MPIRKNEKKSLIKKAMDGNYAGIIISNFRKKFIHYFVKDKKDFDVLESWIKNSGGKIVYILKF